MEDIEGITSSWADRAELVSITLTTPGERCAHNTDSMNYSSLRRSRTYIVVPRDVPPENFLFVPETRKERKMGPSRCIICPLLVFLLAGGLLAGCGYFLHEHSVQGGLVLEWPDSSGILSSYK